MKSTAPNLLAIFLSLDRHFAAGTRDRAPKKITELERRIHLSNNINA